jgi:hypothetical protein
MVFNKTGTAHFLQVIRMTVWLPIEPGNGLACHRRHSGYIWILDATVWRWLLGLSTTRVAGGLLKELKMLKHIIFRWLIFMYTLCDL